MRVSNHFALRVFHWASEVVPAYRHFLTNHQINPRKIKTLLDFQNVPIMDKKNYLSKYNFCEYFPGRKIPPMISASSGSSGQPRYWPRGDEQEIRGGIIHAKIFNSIFCLKQKRTLVVVCFSMGTWIAGTFTTACCRYAARKNPNISIITPGIELQDILGILKNLAPNFERTILAGYPPFLLDVLNAAVVSNIDLKALSLRLILAGENFSENWRSIVHERGAISDPLRGSISIYGTADAAILGHESPLSIFLRQSFGKHKELAREILGEHSFLPAIVQYYPRYNYFESIGNELTFTTSSGLPLIRYNIHDRGQIISFEKVKIALEDSDLRSRANALRLFEWRLPFLVLQGRNDVAITFYALNIYPENIKVGLEDPRIHRRVTGKFIARSKIVNRYGSQRIFVDVESERFTKKSAHLKRLVGECIFDGLMKHNSEYRKLYAAIGQRSFPVVVLKPFGSHEFVFKKAKHKWVKG